MTPVCLHHKTFCKYFTMKIFVCLHHKMFCKYFTMGRNADKKFYSKTYDHSYELVVKKTMRLG